MKTLMIKDLPQTEELDRKAMAAVHGGMHKGPSADYWMSRYAGPKFDYGVSFQADQAIDQVQNVVNNNGNNVAFSEGITSTVKPRQTATNTISL